MTNITEGTRVRFESPLSNGGMARWTAVVVKVVDGIASVRHPKPARLFPFTPVPEKALYRYRVEDLEKAVVA